MRGHSSWKPGSLAGLLACAGLALAAPVGAAGSETAPARGPWPAPRRAATHRSLRMQTSAREHLRAAWGVDELRVSRVASGNLIRFNYRVTNPVQAASLGDKRATPVLYALRTHAVLSVPVMDKVGALRQTGELKAGQEYWLTFSNKGDLVKPGDRVNVVIGPFHADGLTVE
jgi:hypothetical protein